MAVALSVTPVARNGYAYTSALGIPVVNILHVRAATADEITNFSTALTAVVCQDISYNVPTKLTYLTATATATVITALNA